MAKGFQMIELMMVNPNQLISAQRGMGLYFLFASTFNCGGSECRDKISKKFRVHLAGKGMSDRKSSRNGTFCGGAGQ